MNKQKLREKIMEEREKEWIREALRARKFSDLETFEQGLKLIEIPIGLAEKETYMKEEKKIRKAF